MKVRSVLLTAAFSLCLSSTASAAGLCIPVSETRQKIVTAKEVQNRLPGADIVLADIAISDRKCTPMAYKWRATVASIGEFHCRMSDKMQDPYCEKIVETSQQVVGTDASAQQVVQTKSPR